MNYLDIIIVVPSIYAIIKGFSNGLIKELTSLIALFLGVYVAINFSEYFQPNFIVIFEGYEKFVPVLAFGCLFLVSFLCVKIIGILIEKLSKALALGTISKILGGIFGLLKVIVIFSFLVFFVNDYNFVDQKTKDDSVLFDPLVNISEIITPQLDLHKSILDKIDHRTEKVKEKINQKINPK